MFKLCSRVTKYSLKTFAPPMAFMLAAATWSCSSPPGGDATAAADEGQELFADIDSKVIWNRKTVDVCFENSTWSGPYTVAQKSPQGTKKWVQSKKPFVADLSESKSFIREAVEDTWNEVGLVRFVGWGKCAANSRGIRIALTGAARDDASGGSNNGHSRVEVFGAYLDGKHSGMILNTGFREWFNFERSQAAAGTEIGFSTWIPSPCDGDSFTDEDAIVCIKKNAVHEFGHALGFLHEQNRPDAQSTKRGRACLASLPDDAATKQKGVKLGGFDPYSIMAYCNDDWDWSLSKGDVAGYKKFY